VLTQHCLNSGWDLDLFVLNRELFRSYAYMRNLDEHGRFISQPMLSPRAHVWKYDAMEWCLCESSRLVNILESMSRSSSLETHVIERRFLVFFQATESVACLRDMQRTLVGKALRTLGFYVLFCPGTVVVFEKNNTEYAQLVTFVHTRYAKFMPVSETVMCALSGSCESDCLRDVRVTFHASDEQHANLDLITDLIAQHVERQQSIDPSLEAPERLERP